MTWLFSIVGAGLVVLAVTDVFHTLFHPSGRGGLSRKISILVWRASRAMHHKPGSLAGPVGTILSIVFWVLLTAVGWATLYYPHVPDGFLHSSGVQASDYPEWAEALYTSLVTLSTLGYGDVVATDQWIRLLSPVQALVGFALLTAALTWFMQIYPALGRRRALAIRLTLLRETGFADDLDSLGPGPASQLLGSLTGELVQVRVDLTQNAETYFYRESDPRSSLAASLSYATELLEAARRSGEPDVRSSAEMLSAALTDFSAFLQEQFLLSGDDPHEIFDSFAVDHGHRYHPRV